MKKALFKLMVCPDCHAKFHLDIFEKEKNEVKTGVLTCQRCNQWYPISEFVPRIVPEDFFDREEFMKTHQQKLSRNRRPQKHREEHRETIKTFEDEWAHYQEFGYDKRMYNLTRKTAASKKTVKGKIVLDVGCGNGRFSLAASELGAKMVVGIDLIPSVAKTYARLKEKNIHCVQADIFHLPFKEETFDFIFSIGVLHHTQNTKEAFLKLPPLLKRGGIISCTFYKKMGPIRELTDNVIRFFTTRMPRKAVWYLSYIPATIAKILHPIPVWKRKGRWVRLDEAIFATIIHIRPEHSVCFDWWSPKIATRQTWEEVYEWFRQAGLKNIRKIDYGAVAYSGVRR